MRQPVIRRARAGEAEALHALAVRSKAVWGYDAAFMALAAPAAPARARSETGRAHARALDQPKRPTPDAGSETGPVNGLVRAPFARTAAVPHP